MNFSEILPHDMYLDTVSNLRVGFAVVLGDQHPINICAGNYGGSLRHDFLK